MLQIGLTGGIAAGKSTVAAQFVELGAHLIDADALAREVVAPGTPGLARVEAAFGPKILTPDGTLDRAALGRIIFSDPAARGVLNGILHPLIAEETSQRVAQLPAGAIAVHDVPLIVENSLAPNYHLVAVVGAATEVRLARLTQLRNLTVDEANDRIAAQASDAQRRLVADIWIDNDASVDKVRDAVQYQWRTRIAPYARNIAEATPAPRPTEPVSLRTTPTPRTWEHQAATLLTRLRKAGGELVVTADHIGATAVPNLPAQDVLDLQIGVASLAGAEALAGAFLTAGFPAQPGIWVDPPVGDGDPEAKQFHVNADPGRPVNVHVREVGSAAWRFALAFRDRLRSDDAACETYAAAKLRFANAGMSGKQYATAKDEWFSQNLDDLRRWITETGWQPPHS